MVFLPQGEFPLRQGMVFPPQGEFPLMQGIYPAPQISLPLRRGIFPLTQKNRPARHKNLPLPRRDVILPAFLSIFDLRQPLNQFNFPDKLKTGNRIELFFKSSSGRPQ
jgi:hypothetical protein